MQTITRQNFTPKGIKFNLDEAAEIVKDIKSETRIKHDKFMKQDDYENQDDFVVQSWIDYTDLDTYYFDYGWWNDLVPREGWCFSGNYDYLDVPVINYTAGGHIAFHHDGGAIGSDFHQSTSIYCVGSNDRENGGTCLMHGNKLIVKESVTTGKTVTFPAYTVHSGIPVSDGKFKTIFQGSVSEIRKRLDKKDLREIKLKDGSFIVRNTEYQYFNGDESKLPEITKKDFYPTYVAMRGHSSTRDAMVKNENLVLDNFVMEYDTVEEGWYNNMDEATYHADGKPILATIHYGNYIINDLTPDEFARAVVFIARKRYSDKTVMTQLMYPFIKHAKFVTFDNEENYVHVAWRISYVVPVIIERFFDMPNSEAKELFIDMKNKGVSFIAKIGNSYIGFLDSIICYPGNKKIDVIWNKYENRKYLEIPDDLSEVSEYIFDLSKYEKSVLMTAISYFINQPIHLL